MGTAPYLPPFPFFPFRIVPLIYMWVFSPVSSRYNLPLFYTAFYQPGNTRNPNQKDGSFYLLLQTILCTTTVMYFIIIQPQYVYTEAVV